MLSEFDYHCPHCDHKLNDNNELHFLVTCKGNELTKLRLSPVSGVYGYKSDHDLEIKNGDHVDFFCEECEGDLQSKSDPDFVGIYLRTLSDITHELIFSPICGDRKTYVLMDGELVKYGNDFFSIMAYGKKAG